MLYRLVITRAISGPLGRVLGEERVDKPIRSGRTRPLPDLAQWPKYRLNPDISVSTDEPVPHTGLYLPTIDDSCAQFLIEGDPADQANIGYDPKRMQNAGRAPTRWILVERVPGEFVDDPLADLLGGSVDVRVARVPAGLVCPRAGWWQTPANAGARRYFKQGKSSEDRERTPATSGIGPGQSDLGCDPHPATSLAVDGRGLAGWFRSYRRKHATLTMHQRS